MNTAQILATNGILRAPEVVELARSARLELACAAVLLIKESSGGRNVWGRDNVPTAATYDKGGVVTRSDYLAYRAAVQAGRAGRQGCGPTQLTNGALQTAADAIGGCWDWRANCRVGFEHLANLIRAYGMRDGFRRYNGSGAAADRYADDAMGLLGQWRARLAETGDDMPQFTTDEIKTLAAAVWTTQLRNAFGDQVQAIQILNGIEQRLADLQTELAAVRDRLGG